MGSWRGSGSAKKLARAKYANFSILLIQKKEFNWSGRGGELGGGGGGGGVKLYHTAR